MKMPVIVGSAGVLVAVAVVLALLARVAVQVVVVMARIRAMVMVLHCRTGKTMRACADDLSRARYDGGS